jgi:Ser/Thr protein kinase RdoA (MazF antagonist)
MSALPTGIIHGDPFLDNILVDGETGAFSAFVDFEDSCVGPLLFDVACTAAAGCYRPAQDGGPDELHTELLAHFLRGYVGVRRFTAEEAAAFVPFMRLALLCNCAWRFKNFNLDHREVESCRDAYKELQKRIEDLEQPERERGVDELVRAALAAL